MSVDSTNPIYDKLAPLWQTMRDTADGERAVKERGEEYLPKLGGQEPEEYAAFKKRASFFNATRRTIDGLTGMVFRKPPEQKVPKPMEDFMADVTLGGLDFQGFAEVLTEEVLTVERGGILVEFPHVDSSNMTRAQAEGMNLRPFFSLYKIESIIDWRIGQVSNKAALTQVRLRETAIEPIDEFTDNEIEQIRVLDLDEYQLYRQRVFRKVEGSDKKRVEWVQFGDDILPTMNSKRMEYIPFIFAGSRDTMPICNKPPLIDLADKNLDHYRIDADYKHSLHFIAAASTRYVTGVTQEEIDSGVFDLSGPTTYHASTSKEAKFGITEPTGEGIPSLERALQGAEQQMSVLGARLLSPDKKQTESAETAAIHKHGEASVLASLAQAVSGALTQALEIARDWMGLTEEVFVKLNTDYTAQGMSAQYLVALTGALQNGGISLPSYIEALQRGEALRDDLSVDEEIARIVKDQEGSFADGP